MSNGENSLLHPLQAPRLRWTESGEPRSDRFDDVYFSAEDGLAESEHVFLRANQLPERWRENTATQFAIAETGFGTGLNFLLSWRYWQECAPAATRLHYLSLEQYPLHLEDIRRCVQLWPSLATFGEQLLAQYPLLLDGNHRLVFDEGRVILDLYFGEASRGLDVYSSAKPGTAFIDAWYLDGFAPAKNQSLWSPALFTQIAGLSRRGTTFATFTAAGAVRRGLQEAGFTVEKVPGFGTKREMLRGRFDQDASGEETVDTHRWRVPWHHGSPRVPSGRAVILGAGLAGCTTAHALARRGWEVTLVESGPEIAAGASGNDQGVLYTRLSHRYSPLADFSLRSYLFALAFYREQFDSGQLAEGKDGQFCGALHIGKDPHSLLLAQMQQFPALARWLDTVDASKVSGVDNCPPGLFFPGSGWLHPPAVCRAALVHDNITLRCGAGLCTLSRDQNEWCVLDSTGAEVARAPVAILCTGTGITRQHETSWLPLRPIRGQVTHIPETDTSLALHSVICHEGYLAPARQGRYCIGATFELDNDNPTPGSDGHRLNLAQLTRALPQYAEDMAALDPEQLTGRVGFRCTSPDYLPLVGPAPVPEEFNQRYEALRKDARSVIPQTGSYHPGLYLNTAHGSRGLTSTPLAAELLASLLCGEFAPVSEAQQRALAPARFLIRDLVRNRN